VSDALPITDILVIPAEDLRFEFARSGGPGGQHVNTTDSKVRLRFAIDQCQALNNGIKQRMRAARPGDLTSEGELLIVCDEHRSRQQNIDTARARLAALVIASLLPPKVRKKTKPSKGAQRARLETKGQRSGVKKMRGKVRGDD
jgi:ribosome-associated protein